MSNSNSVNLKTYHKNNNNNIFLENKNNIFLENNKM